MKHEKPIFYICKKCGNIVGLIKNGGGELVCCEEKMSKIEPNIVETSVEKHLPVYTYENNILTVTVGSTEHPMTENHYIEWICVMQDGKVQRQRILPGEKPEAKFFIDDIKEAEIYAYCNLHSLWLTVYEK